MAASKRRFRSSRCNDKDAKRARTGIGPIIQPGYDPAIRTIILGNAQWLTGILLFLDGS